MGILQMIAERAHKPSHLNTVHKCLSVVMNKVPTKVISPNFAAFFCNSAAKLHVPELGLAFIQVNDRSYLQYKALYSWTFNYLTNFIII